MPCEPSSQRHETDSDSSAGQREALSSSSSPQLNSTHASTSAGALPRIESLDPMPLSFTSVASRLQRAAACATSAKLWGQQDLAEGTLGAVDLSASLRPARTQAEGLT